MTDYRSIAPDEASRARLEERGLLYGLVDTSDAASFDQWLQADVRAFHGGTLTDEQLGWWREGLAYRRTTGVWDDDLLVATTNAWPTAQTVPGGRTVESWAISSVGVAPTHRRRGVARALLEGELRTAAALGVPVAMLTVSEATLYGRYGFAPRRVPLRLHVRHPPRPVDRAGGARPPLLHHARPVAGAHRSAA